MRTGSASGEARSRSLGPSVAAFVDDEGGYTTVAVAVALLVSLSLVFGAAAAQWAGSRSAEVQEVADAAALSGQNAVAAYSTVAQVMDACVLSMGLTGFVTAGAGLVLCCVPGLASAGTQMVETGAKVLETRRSFSAQASDGLKRLESALPTVVVANSASCVVANAQRGISYVGCAVPLPLESASDFSALTDDASADDLKDLAEKIAEQSDKAGEAKKSADEALRRGWEADCGMEPRCLWERASTLAGLGDGDNPYYASVESWSFGVPLLRARSYYAARLAAAEVAGNTAEEMTDAACRKAYFGYAVARVRAGSYAEHADGTVSIDLPTLAHNAQETRETSLFTDAVWPTTVDENGIRTLHSWSGCPGATGAAAAGASLSQMEGGGVSRCETCKMDVGQMGRVAAASTPIDNGFEHYWKKIVEAAREYQSARAELAAAERATKELAGQGKDAFAEAARKLSVSRPSLCPPGAWGCVAVVSRGEGAAVPSELTAAFLAEGRLPAGAAVSAAVLAPDSTGNGNDVISTFFDDLVASGSVLGGVADGVCGLWGRLLVGYGSAYDSAGKTASDFLGGLDGVLGDSTGSWLAEKLGDAVGVLGIEPADLRARKPVLTNTANVLEKAGYDHVSKVRELVSRLPDSGGVFDYARSLGIWASEEYGGVITLAELKIPGTQTSIPLTIDLSKLGGYLEEGT